MNDIITADMLSRVLPHDAMLLQDVGSLTWAMTPADLAGYDSEVVQLVPEILNGQPYLRVVLR